MPVTVRELAEAAGAQIEGDADRVLTGVAPLESAGPEDLSFLGAAKYEPLLASTRAGALFIDRTVPSRPGGPTLLRVDHPYLAFARAMPRFDDRPVPPPGVDPSAVVDPSAALGRGVSIGPLCSIGPGARIGDRVILHALVAVGAEAVIGDDCILYSHVSVRERCRLGRRVILQNGVQIGGDGFGFIPLGGYHEKIAQIGNVVIEDDVEIGALSAVDRAMMAQTVIGAGTKTDDLVMIGHNVRIGEHCLLVAQVGIAGSTQIGSHVILGGQVGVVGHIQIGDRVRVGAQSGVAQDLPSDGDWSGTPAIPHRRWLKNAVLAGRLDEMRDEIRRLRVELTALRKEKKSE